MYIQVYRKLKKTLNISKTYGKKLGLLAKPGAAIQTPSSFIHSFIKSLILWENIITATPRPNCWRWCFQSLNRPCYSFLGYSKSWRAFKSHWKFCVWREVVCIENFSIQTLDFILIWVSTSLHRQWFSPYIWIQEKVLSTDNGFSLKSNFTKKFSSQTISLRHQELWEFKWLDFVSGETSSLKCLQSMGLPV